jgi:hypothetical protein
MLSSYLILANRPTDQEGTLPTVHRAVRRKRLPWSLTRANSRFLRPALRAHRVGSVAPRNSPGEERKTSDSPRSSDDASRLNRWELTLAAVRRPPCDRLLEYLQPRDQFLRW